MTASDVANRTLLQVMHESLVEHGLFPTDKAVKVDRMVALADPLGQMNSSDQAVMELNPETGRYENGARDPVAPDATSTEDYLAKLRVFLTSMAFVCQGLTCSAAPHLIAGSERRAFCSFGACLAFHRQAEAARSRPLAQVRAIVELSLRDVMRDVNTRGPGRRSCSSAFRHAKAAMEKRMEPMVIYGRADAIDQPEPGPAAAPPSTASLGQLSADDLRQALVAASAAQSPPAWVGGLVEALSADRKRSRDREGRTEERKKRVVLDDDGAVLFRARQGGNNDAPRCEDRTCHKKSWCAHSHTHLQ